MASVKPQIVETNGSKKIIGSTDTIAPNNLAPGGVDGQFLQRNSAVSGGQQWATAVAAAGDFDSVLTGSSTISANKQRVLSQLLINDGGGILIIEDGAILAIV